MSLSHAVVWLDHHSAQLLQFDADHVQTQKVKAHSHHTRQHGSGVRTEHEFFGELCDTLDGVTEVLVTGSRTPQADFRHYVDKHCPALVPRIIGWETVDHPSEGQLLAFARKYFTRDKRPAVTPVPT
jgi:hypothetical protein